MELKGSRLNFLYCDGTRLADFHTAFTSEALVLVHRFGLAINDFIHVHRTYIDTFGIASAFVFVNGNFEHLSLPPLILGIRRTFRLSFNRGLQPPVDLEEIASVR
jgi:hypothetical protein